LFYEASEGGAGVLTRIVHEPATLASIAREALRLMHFAIPQNDSDALPETDSLTDVEGACVKGCYRCLLSYFNQPDHEVIDRRDLGARELLGRLARARTTVDTAEARSSAGTAQAPASNAWTSRWIEAAQGLSVPLPQWVLHESVVPRWPSSYAAVILPDAPKEIRDSLDLEGSTLFVFPPDVERWPDAFARLARYLGPGA
jgi:hypothetical protein